MEKKQYELCLEVLRRFHRAGILRNIILVGSWCVYFYKDYFAGVHYIPTIRTRDIDFLVPLPPKIKKKVSIPNLLKDLGFLVDFRGSKGYIRLAHPALIVEFLIPERGRGFDKPYPLPLLGLNAQPLRFLDFLVDNTISLKVDSLALRLPHPAALALHKLIIFQRRIKEDKADKEKEQAFMILKALIAKKDEAVLKRIFNAMPESWKRKVFKALKKREAKDILEVLENTISKNPRK